MIKNDELSILVSQINHPKSFLQNNTLYMYNSIK